MLRRSIPVCLAVSALAVITASATDFWISKDWKQWLRSDCENLLTESPWATHGKAADGRVPSLHIRFNFDRRFP